MFNNLKQKISGLDFFVLFFGRFTANMGGFAGSMLLKVSLAMGVVVDLIEGCPTHPG